MYKIEKCEQKQFRLPKASDKDCIEIRNHIGAVFGKPLNFDDAQHIRDHFQEEGLYLERVEGIEPDSYGDQPEYDEAIYLARTADQAYSVAYFLIMTSNEKGIDSLDLYFDEEKDD